MPELSGAQPMSFNNPPANASDIGPNLKFALRKKALIEVEKERRITRLSNVENMPMHSGDTMYVNRYLPIIDDRNRNNQGIDANGATIVKEAVVYVYPPDVDTSNTILAITGSGSGADDATSLVNAKNNVYDKLINLGLPASDYATLKGNLVALGWTFVDTLGTVPISGNLYGSTDDINLIANNLPLVSEQGGRVHRVGVTRIQVTGTFNQLGFFTEYTRSARDKDDDIKYEMHVNREMLRAANKVTEDYAQLLLLNNAGNFQYTGIATSMAELSGETGAVTALTYKDFVDAEITLDLADCPMDTKIIKGSTNVDTRVIHAARVMFAPTQLKNTLNGLVNDQGEAVLIRLAQYAKAGEAMDGEYGSVGGFRIVINREMHRYAGAGAPVTNNDGYHSSSGKYDVFPLLVVGDGSFTHLSFRSGTGRFNFEIIHKKPGASIADRHNPYGLVGFMSILWNQGVLIEKPERLLVIKTVAKY